MQVQLACVLFLCFMCGGLCSASEVDPEQRALQQDLLSSLFSAKMKQSRQSAPFWHVSLATLCRLLSGFRDEAWSSERQVEEEDEEERAEVREGPAPLMEELYGLQLLCRALQNREERLLKDSVDYIEDNSDAPLKRKSPYILKRQASHSTKSRRPYILKRSSLY